jgi:hypothetical protein
MKRRRSKVASIVGLVFGRLTVTTEVLPGEEGATRRMAVCRCECGALKTILRQSLVGGLTASCGCQAHRATTTHGLSDSATYRTWKSMRDRCENPGSTGYERYGARGIRVCDRWQSFEAFVADMGERPSRTTLDRIDNALGYEPGNCRWASAKTQARNQAKTKLTQTMVDDIRRRKAAGESSVDLAAEYQVSTRHLDAVAGGRFWQPDDVPTPG